MKSRVRDKKVRFEFVDPEAQRVSVAGDFNGWDADRIPLKRDVRGIWRASLSLEAGRYEYLFRVDDTWQADPNAQNRVDNPFGSQNCVRIVR